MIRNKLFSSNIQLGYFFYEIGKSNDKFLLVKFGPWDRP